jgi:mono/diheme cytochrome c family protein
MPNLRLTDSEAADVTAYLSSLKNPTWDAKTPAPSDPAALDSIVLEFLRATSTKAKAEADLAAMSADQKNLYAGEKLIGRYACYACHTIPGFENAQPIGTELTEAGTKLLSQLDFGFLHIEHTRDAWYTQKLTDPRIFDVGRSKRPEELLVMPNFGLSPADVHSIVTVLTSMVKDRINLEMKSLTSPAVAAGRMLIAEKNCKGCHVIERLGGDIRVHLKDMDREWPPNLNTQGQKTEPEWLRAFLKDPTFEKPRWWMTTRMPTFDFTESQISVLGKYFAELDKLVDWPYNNLEVETTPQMLAAGKQLFTLSQCDTCHPSTPGGNNETRSGVAPNLTLTHGRLRPDWTLRWLTDPALIDPQTRMPAFFQPDATGKRVTTFTDILGGDVDAQLRALRDYTFSLGGPVKTTTN